MKANSTAKLFALLAAVWLVGTANAMPFTYTFSTQPTSGTIHGVKGQLIGWGYDLTNEDSTNWLITTTLSASSFTVGMPDASYFDFPILAPGQRATINFDPATYSGLYALTLGGSVLPGQRDVGVFALGGEWWSGDPFSGGALLRAAAPQTANFTASVIASPSGVPEPGTLLLLGAGLALLPLVRKRPREKFQEFGRGLG